MLFFLGIRELRFEPRLPFCSNISKNKKLPHKNEEAFSALERITHLLFYYLCIRELRFEPRLPFCSNISKNKKLPHKNEEAFSALERITHLLFFLCIREPCFEPRLPFCSNISKSKKLPHKNEEAFSALERIRTPNPRSRNPIFYPVELRVQFPTQNYTKKPSENRRLLDAQNFIEIADLTRYFLRIHYHVYYPSRHQTL